MISKLCGQILHLARHKFASNVVEKALVFADANSRRMLIDEMMATEKEGASSLITMMKDQFASNCCSLLPCFVFSHIFCRLCSSACFGGGRRVATRSLDH